MHESQKGRLTASCVSLYFFAGDFVDVLRRHQEGRQQIYQTHNEVARLVYDLLAAGWRVNIYSFVTPQYRDDRPTDGLRVISLGASNYAASSLLKDAVAGDDADAIVAHIANLELLRAVTAKNSRAVAMLANSYNRRGVRSTIEKFRVVSLLNNPKFELVSNHCLPATEQLSRMGVKRDKLIPWDIAHPFDPACRQPKELAARQVYEAVYAGSIMEGKGVTDLVRAIALLRQRGLEVHCMFAGTGDVNGLRTLSEELGVSDLMEFVGLIGNVEVFERMAAADLVAIPSRTEYPEGFPLTMFEAIASRTPIVCSDHPMFRPVIRDGQNACVFPASDYQALAAAVQRLLGDASLYATLSANATSTWAALKGPADWRTLILKWVTEGRSSPWLGSHMLTAVVKSPQIGVS